MVSVIIPVYNSNKYLSDSIESLKNQTYSNDNIEVIIVDDGSTDNSKLIALSYKDKFKNFQYIYQSNKGPGSARNSGMNFSNGEFITFLDSDDIYKPEKIEAQLKTLSDNPCIDIVYNDAVIADEKLKALSIYSSEYEFDNKNDFLAVMLFRQIIPAPASIMFRRKCFQEGIRYNENIRNAEDYDFTINLAKKYDFKYLRKPLYVYRRHNLNLSNEYLLQTNNEIEIIRNLGIDYIKEILEKSSFSTEQKKSLLAKIFYKISDLEKALEILLQLVRKDKSFESFFYIANCYYKSNNILTAIKFYNKALAMSKEHVEVYNNLGCCYISNNIKYAVDLFSSALSLNNNYMDAKYNLLNCSTCNFKPKFTERILRKNLFMYTEL